MAKSSLISLHLKDPEVILQCLEDLRTHKSGINWVMMGYDGEDIKLFGTGKGGFNEMIQLLKDDEIRFVVLEVAVKGDDYNPVKYVLISWIGTKVPPGVGKARAGGNRIELLDFIQHKIAIAAEFQPAMRSDLTTQALADKLTRIARQDASNKVEEKKHTMARPEANKGDRTKSQLKVDDFDSFSRELQKVHSREVTWMTMGYVEGQKDRVAFINSGVGLDNLKKQFPHDKIIYAAFSQQVKETTNITNKILLITMVGEKTGPLIKARSGAQRAELADFIKDTIPFHSHYQASTADDLVEDKILDKLRQ